MTDPRIAQIQNALAGTAGGYLRNPGGPGTCSRCYTPTVPGPMCHDCRRDVTTIAGGPDLLGMMTYAGYLDPIAQSGHVMRGYKNPRLPRAGHWQTVSLLAALALLGHTSCPGLLLGTPVSAWATVPSLPPKVPAAAHPLNEMVRQLARPGAREIQLIANSKVQNPRSVNVNHFSVVGDDAHGSHVLLIDDTWTGGGHATSAALALRAGGARYVSVLVLARWLTNGWGATTPAWAKRRLTAPDFQPEYCPWTRSQCPQQA